MNEEMAWGSVNPDHKYYKKGLANKLTSICYEAFNGESGEIDFIVAILLSGARNRDYKFFNSTLYEHYCELIGLNHLYVLQLISKISDHYDYGVEFDFELLNVDEELDVEIN